MKLDLTKEIILDEKNQKAYRVLQTTLYAFSLFAFIYFSFLIMFPSQSFIFSFLNPDASSNTITRPRNSLGVLIKNGKVGINDELYFDASLIGNYSQAKATFVMSKKSEMMESGRIDVVRSYQAFLYPEEAPLGFKDGTLVKSDNNYYIVSSGELRKFKSFAVLKSIGFSEKSFVDADQEDLQYNNLGATIIDDKSFPESSIFKIEDNYYILKNAQLRKFTSQEAYLSQFASEQALEKDANFLDQFSLSESNIGFNEGSLISYGDAVYLVSGEYALPVDSSITFEAAGYSWDDVIPVSSDEVSFYKKGKLFTLKDPHPEGTIFSTVENGSYYLIKDKKKFLLPSAIIAYSWLRKSPILVSETSSNMTVPCKDFKKDIFTFRSYSCEMKTDELNTRIGKDFEFKANFSNSVEFDTIRIKFKRTVTLDNLRQSVSDILNRIRNNYARQ